MKTINVFTLFLAMVASLNGNASTGAGNGPDLAGEALPLTVERLIDLRELDKISQVCMFQAAMEICESIKGSSKGCKVEPTKNAHIFNADWGDNVAKWYHGISFGYQDSNGNQTGYFLKINEEHDSDKWVINDGRPNGLWLEASFPRPSTPRLGVGNRYEVGQTAFFYYKKTDLVTDILGQYKSVTKVSIGPKKLVNPNFVNKETQRSTPIRFPGENHRNCLIRGLVSNGK